MSAPVFGNVPHPPFTDRLIKDSQNWAWDPLGPRKIYGIVQHTMVGTLWGTDTYFRSGTAAGLTDYGIGGASDGADDGLILRWNDPTGKGSPGVSPHRWPWASGPCENSSGDAVEFIETFGPNAVNGYLVSIERSDGGTPEAPASAKYIESFTRLVAHYADLAQIPYDQYPFNPNSGCSSYLWHSEIYGAKTCPAGAKAATDEIQQEVARILKAAQTGGGDTDGEEEENPLADLPKSEYVLDPDLIWKPSASEGAVGQLWREYGRKTGIFNPPAQPWNDEVPGGWKLYRFDGGPVITSKGGKAELVVEVE